MANTRITSFENFQKDFNIHYEDGFVVKINFFNFLEEISTQQHKFVGVVLAQCKFISENPSIKTNEWKNQAENMDTSHEVSRILMDLSQRNDTNLNRSELNNYLENGLVFSLDHVNESFYSLSIFFRCHEQVFKIFFVIDLLNKSFSFFDRFHPWTHHYKEVLTLANGLTIVSGNDSLNVVLSNGVEKEYSITNCLFNILPYLQKISVSGYEVDFMMEILGWYQAYKSFCIDNRGISEEDHFRNSIRQLIFSSSIGQETIEDKFLHSLISGLIYMKPIITNYGLDAILFYIPIGQDRKLVKIIDGENLFQNIFFPDLFPDHYENIECDERECGACFEQKTTFLKMSKCPTNGCSTSNYCYDCYKNFGFKCMICKAMF